MSNREQEGYNYATLAEAVKLVGETVHFYGVVAAYEQPKPTRGRDYLCTMTVIDTSYNSPGLRVLFFAPRLDQMPRVKDLGDVIRFHRLQMKTHSDAPQASGNERSRSSFVLFRGCEGDDYVPYQNPSGTSFTMEASDRNIVGLLRTWASSHSIDTLAGTSKYMKQIKDVAVDSYCDVCCKILFVSEQSAENKVIMHVWDGTDASPACLNPSGVPILFTP